MLGLIARIEDPLTRCEASDLDTGSEDLRFVVVEKLKKWNMAKLLRFTGHSAPPDVWIENESWSKDTSRFERFILVRL
jgi:hypothetical protein